MSLSILYLASSENSVIAVGSDVGGIDKYLHTTDGFNWQYKNFPNLNSWQGATYGSGKYVVVNNDDVNNLYVSNRNGLDWTGYTIPGMHSNNILRKPSFANNLFFLDSSMSDNQFFYSSDATNWFTGSFPIYTNLEKVIYADNLNLYIGLLTPKTRNYLYSNNGINWNTGLFPIEGRWNDIAYDGTKFITLSDWSSDLYYSRTGLFSTNGINWNTLMLPNNNYDNIIYNKNLNLYMIASQPANPSGSVAISSNGFNWRATGEVNLNNNIITNFKDKFIQHGLDAIVSGRLYVHSKLPFTFENQESGNLYSPASTWSNGIGNANIGNWFFVDRAGTFRGIINTNQNGRTSIGNSGFFFAPSSGSAAFYVDGYFNLINPLINGQGISLNANYSWNGGMRGIEFKPLTEGDSIFRIEHGNGDDRIFLRGSGFSDRVILNNGFQQALNYNIVYQKTGILFEARNFVNNNLIYSTGIITNLSIRQVHFYVGNILATPVQQLNYGLGVNNLSINYKQKVPF